MDVTFFFVSFGTEKEEGKSKLLELGVTKSSKVDNEDITLSKFCDRNNRKTSNVVLSLLNDLLHVFLMFSLVLSKMVPFCHNYRVFNELFVLECFLW